MNTILRLIEQNRINYGTFINESVFNINWDGDCRYGVIIPVRGREGFLPVLLDSFRQTRYRDLCITVVEHSDTPTHRNTCAVPDVNYIHIPAKGAMFNKCLAMNMGVIASCLADYYIFHDLDCLVQQDFFKNLDVIVDSGAEAIQTFKDTRPLYCEAMLTEKLLHGDIGVNELSIGMEGIFEPKRRGAPGGSILTSRGLFFKVGGYDPELFSAYSPEDEFFWHKLLTYTTVHSCQANEVFHMHHPSFEYTNPNLKFLIALMKRFRELPIEEKKKIIEYKSQTLSQYAVC